MHAHIQHLTDYLNGIKRVRPRELLQLNHLTNWRDLAQREIEHRGCALLRAFDDELLHAIATGEVDVNTTIADVLGTD